MPIRQRLVTYGIPATAIATIVTGALFTQRHGEPAVTQPTPTDTQIQTVPTIATNAAVHHVDVVFAVDTTGSMGGLIEGAKRTVWSIATHIRQTDPQADLRIGLVAYKDIGDVYVTRDFPLTTDLDSVFAELSSYTAAGGGDDPEDVDAALYDAVYKMKWGDDAKKLVFLVGDAPPATRGDVPAFDITAREAGARHIAGQRDSLRPRSRDREGVAANREPRQRRVLDDSRRRRRPASRDAVRRQARRAQRDDR